MILENVDRVAGGSVGVSNLSGLVAMLAMFSVGIVLRRLIGTDNWKRDLRCEGRGAYKREEVAVQMTMRKGGGVENNQSVSDQWQSKR